MVVLLFFGLVTQEEQQRTAEGCDECAEQVRQLELEGILECGQLLVAALVDGREDYVLGRRTMPEMDPCSVACVIQNLWLAARTGGERDRSSGAGSGRAAALAGAYASRLRPVAGACNSSAFVLLKFRNAAFTEHAVRPRLQDCSCGTLSRQDTPPCRAALSLELETVQARCYAQTFHSHVHRSRFA
jgi:hypothetical protein